MRLATLVRQLVFIGGCFLPEIVGLLVIIRPNMSGSVLVCGFSGIGVLGDYGLLQPSSQKAT